MAIALTPNWQQHLKNWPERISHINQKDQFADFKFIVGPEKTVFHAHKLIFGLSSPEFENLFYLLETDLKEIDLPDNSAPNFEAFVNFIYTGKIGLTVENVKEIVKLAKLYSITLLVDKCESFLEENVENGNVLKFLDIATDNNFLKVTSKCFEIIYRYSKEICESPEFVEISKQSLDKIAESEMLCCDELILFKAVDKWSEFQCEMNQLEVTSENKRAAVGDIIFNIRATLLSVGELIDIVNTKTSLLAYTDLPHLSKKNHLKKRIGQLTIERCLRFDSGPLVVGAFSGGALRFHISVSKNVFLCGFGVYGRRPEALENYREMKYTITLKNADDLILAKISKTFDCDGTDKIYEIFFQFPVLLEPLALYNIRVHLDGPNDKFINFYGENGRTKIVENGVIFTISKDSNFTSKTDPTTDGTIASMIFRC